MSRVNKVNKDHYTQRGRLTPDELARERARAIYVSDTKRKFTARRKSATRTAGPGATPDRSEPEAEG